MEISEYEARKAEFKSNPEFREWLHELTVAGYGKQVIIEAKHEDAIIGIYVLKGSENIETCLDRYLDFKRRWKALGGK